MKYYIIRNKQMPWGDYGNILAYGFISKNDDGEILVERVAPMIPDVYLYNKYIAVIDSVKKTVEQENLAGYYFEKAIKSKIVEIDWSSWDETQKIPEKPKSGEPEDFILKRNHNIQLAEKTPDIWVMMINATSAGEIDKSKKGLSEYSHIQLHLNDWDGSDIFRTPQLGHVFCTEKAKSVLEQNTQYLNFFEVEHKS